MFKLTKLLHNDRGSVAVEFAFIMPLLAIISFGILDFVGLFFEYHRANETTRLIARELAAQSPFVSQTTLVNNTEVNCAKVTCNDMTSIVTKGQEVMPHLKSSNLNVKYEAVDIGGVGYSIAFKPIITVELTGISYQFMFIDMIPGVPSAIGVNPGPTSLIGNWY